MLEHTVTVAKFTVLEGQTSALTGLPVNRMDRLDAIGHLNAVSTDILNRRAPYQPGNQRQIGKAVKTLVMTPHNKIMPRLARADSDHHLGVVVAQHFAAPDGHEQCCSR